MRKRLSIIALLIALLAIAAVAVYLAEKDLNSSNVESSSHRYLSYNGDTSKIYLIAAATSYGTANETYITPTGQLVLKGDPLFIATIMVRNDYTSDNPPPSLPNKDQTSPADGTAYLYLTAKIYSKDIVLNATNVSVSDFTVPLTPGTGAVLASGETASVNILMATTHNDISKCDVNLIFLGDSIPP